MLKYIFILGKNWHLSLAEINHILQKEGYRGKITDYSACAAIVEFEKGELKEEKIAILQFELGGTQKICRAVDFIDQKSFLSAFPEKIEGHPGVMIDARRFVENTLKDTIYPIFGKIEPIKYFVANSIYPVEFSDEYYKTLLNYFLHFINKFWVQSLKEKGAKNVLYYRYPEEYIKSGTLNPIFPHHFMKYELYRPEKKELVYALTEEGMYIGYTQLVSNSNEMKMIDEERPYINQKGSIPPKFVKMMINFLDLTHPYQSQRILDPFCGSGTIPLFAYSLGIQTFGADSDNECVEGTRKNLKWMKQYLERPVKININKNIVKADISELPKIFANVKFHGIVTEPILLPYFRQLPKYNEIIKVVEDKVIPIYTQTFEVAKKLLKPHSKICITSPSIETLDGGKIRINIEEMAKDSGFKKIDVMEKRKIAEKSNKNLRLGTRNNIAFDTGSKYLNREFYIFENIKEN